MKKNKWFTLYEIGQFEQDFGNIAEYNNTKDLQEKLKKDYNITTKNIRQYINNDIDNIKHILNDRFVIIKEEETEEED